ncbi:MAG TPA: DUF5985 family protein [Actinomycetota bacterium]|nr:DUF5985 family protein [Actinomycetota bacterium]
MAAVVYVLCALTAALCAILLLRAYARGRFRLLLWSGICFSLLTVNNVFLWLDKVVITDTDLGWVRNTSGLLALLFLLYGLVWDTDR